jgi:arabinose-5-phosphate isomerase
VESYLGHATGIVPGKSTEPFADFVTNQLHAVLLKEMQALELVCNQFPPNAHVLVRAMLQTTGRVVFSCTGKSGLVGHKLAATCASLGIPSFFLHPHEALHGDLGMVTEDDLFVGLSKSATGAELSIIVAALKLIGVTTALISCSPGILTHEVDVAIVLPFEQEACSLNLAPTNSSTITMAFGDALAIVVSSIKKFSRSDFARFHPAGALGKQLSLNVSMLMYKAPSLPFINPYATFENFLLTITEKKMGVGIVVDESEKLLGIITDGDLRRACKQGPSVFSATASSIMSRHPKTIAARELAATALGIMEAHNITSLVVTENLRVVGILHIHEIIKAGIKSL